jgi:hypothetical protein
MVYAFESGKTISKVEFYVNGAYLDDMPVNSDTLESTADGDRYSYLHTTGAASAGNTMEFKVYFSGSSGGGSGSGSSYATDTIVDGVLYIGTNTTRIADQAYYNHAQSAEITKIVIPSGVTQIGMWSFRELSNLKSIVIPLTVKSVLALAFFGCNALTDVYYEGSQSDWNNIYIDTTGTGNSTLSNANIHYNS